MDNATHIQEGRSNAMENYVDFSGTKKNWLNSYQREALSPADKSKYDTIVWASQLGAVLAGSVVAYAVKKKTNSTWKAVGFGLGTTLAGYLVAYLATKSYSDKLGASTGVSSDAMTAMNTKMKADLDRLKAEALKDYSYSYNYGIK